MKYTCTIEIDAPIEQVAELWADENHFAQWQDDFESIELIEGAPGAIGSLSKIKYNGTPKIVLAETILKNDLPRIKVGQYDHKHMTNTQTTRFEAIDNNRTLFTSEVEYTKFNGFMIKLFAKLFPGKFKQQSQKWMNQFRSFAENQL